MKYTIRKMRREKGLTQERMAELIGVSLGMYNLLEAGKRRMNEDHLAAIATALGVKPSDLYADRSERVEALVAMFRGLPLAYQDRLLEEAEILRRASPPPSPEGGPDQPAKGRRERP